MQLHGEYLHRIDPQGRIAIPARYREAFRGGIYLTKGFDPAYGARPLRRAVEKFLEDPLAEELLRGNIAASETVEVTGDEDGLKFNQLAGAS